MNKEERLLRFEQLKTQLQHCRVCENQMKDEPHPIFQGSLDSKIFQISQAPVSYTHLDVYKRQTGV